MTTDEFWGVVDSVTGAQTMDSKCSLLRDALGEVSDDRLAGFVKQFDRVHAALYSWPLWGAAYVIGGGCGDDSFADFRAVLISCGRDVVDAAIADPDALAELEVAPDDVFYEGFQYVAFEVAESRGLDLSQSRVSQPDEPTGAEWDEDELAEMFPALWKRYGSDGSVTEENDDASPSQKNPWWKFWG